MTVNNTTTETNLVSYTVLANTLGTDKALRLRVYGDWLQNTGADRGLLQFKLKYGGTTLIDTSQPGAQAGAGAGRKSWELTATINALGATNSQWATINGWTGYIGSAGTNSAAFATGVGSYNMYNTLTGGIAQFLGANTGAIDSTANQDVVLTVTNAIANASYEAKMYYAVVEVIE